MRQDSQLSSFVREKLHEGGQTGGFFIKDERFVKAMLKISSTQDEDQLVSEVQAALQAVDDHHRLKEVGYEYAAQAFLQCLRKGIVTHLKGDWQEDIIDQAIMYTQTRIDEIAPIIHQMAEQMDFLVKGMETLLEGAAPTDPLGKLIPQLPNAPINFTGREKYLEKLEKQIKNQIAIIQGAPGVGKTALAYQFGHQIKDKYPDGRIYLNLRGIGDTTEGQGTPKFEFAPMTPVEVIRGILTRLGASPDNIPEDMGELLDLYRRTLAGKQVLIFLDNALDGEQVENAVHITPHNAYLITSRQTFSVKGQQPIHLEEMRPEKAAELIQVTCTGREISDKDAKELAGELGYLPLALRLAGNTLNENLHYKTLEYLQRLKTESDKLSLMEPGRKVSTIEAAAEVSLMLLPSEPIDYPRQWIELGIFAGDFSSFTAESICPLERYQDEITELPEYEDTLNLLKNYGLLEWEKETGRYDFHDLLRVYARSHWEEEQELRLRHADFFKRLLSYADDLFTSGESDEEERQQSRQQAFNLYTIEETEIVAARDWLIQQVEAGTNDDPVCQLCSDMYGNAVFLLDVRMSTRERIPWLHAANTACRRTGDRRGEGAALGNLGLAYADLGEVHKAIEYSQQALAIAQEIGDRLGEGNHLGNLGIAYRSLGEVHKAIEYYQQSLIIHREIGDQRGEGTDLGNLGLAYANLGEVHKAIEYYQQSLTIDKEIGNRRAEGVDLGNLGNAYADIGEIQTAIEYHKQSLAIAQEIGDRLGEGNQFGNLGTILRYIGEIHKALEYYKQALAIAQEIGDRRGEGSRLSNLGVVYRNLGEVQIAIEYYKQALAISQEIGDRRGEGAVLGNLGNVYFEVGEVQTAIEHHKQALVIAQEIGDRHGEGNHLGNLGLAYASLGEVHKAIEYCEQALAISQEIGDRQRTAIWAFNLALSIHDNDPLQAKELLCQAYQLWVQMGIPYHKNALELMQEWGITPEDCQSLSS